MRYEMGEYVPEFDGNAVVLIKAESDVTSFKPEGQFRNLEAPGPVDLPIHVPMSANRDRGWMRPRLAVVEWTENPPGGLDLGSKIFIPILRAARYERYATGSVGTFRGGSFRIVSKLPEVLRS